MTRSPWNYGEEEEKVTAWTSLWNGNLLIQGSVSQYSVLFIIKR